MSAAPVDPPPCAPDARPDGSTHFGYSSVPVERKAEKVAEVFDSVASNYDVMNDLMSAGMHRAWKAFTVRHAALRPGMKVLDIAGGTGDLARAFARRVGHEGEVWLTDINGSMLAVGRDRLLDEGLSLPVAQCDAEHLPFPSGRFDRVTVAFGLRNMTRKEAALREMHRVLAPGGRLLVLEFSKVWKPLEPAYDAYSFGVLPRLGRMVAGDADSYRYLAESIRMHPDQPTLGALMETAGFGRVRWHNLSFGVVALHEGVKF
ncbi:MAG: bifunctional demethylmenaquinone methyltransferase/2-methoxy-6-polyprenyl-1,4-benzoquinol methylase UbiE [Burkholderiaceae bacterium]|nr:bifunctional demethylmenaquinone methyltransferase/2-methoxy-6-polyprenyl-1,4-benzoquinol methylase UbiE [Burkholderiales bacterium]MCZ8096836.1 bifunctional demethylmenaquinone methyltransferase/2-methoxy-6-polyprenyl-1,4-benzoquinol methylase UbiE [Burkholderiales bacterium]MCZ8339473.1 bifunctional demethylmenaquinone methyltransferase/2-methoxy-6-polyprenyl-1,4-benzoquinol methylase UbiE [Burkholderiaceae bacterium]